jgi:hypothetical protein
MGWALKIKTFGPSNGNERSEAQKSLEKFTLFPHHPSPLPSRTKRIYNVPLPPPPHTHASFVQNNLEIKSDMKSGLDKPPVHKITIDSR